MKKMDKVSEEVVHQGRYLNGQGVLEQMHDIISSQGNVNQSHNEARFQT